MEEEPTVPAEMTATDAPNDTLAPVTINDVTPPAPETMATPPAVTPDDDDKTEAPTEPAPAEATPPVTPEPPKAAKEPSQSNAKLAIFATVFIVIVLAGLAVFAYLKQK